MDLTGTALSPEQHHHSQATPILHFPLPPKVFSQNLQKPLDFTFTTLGDKRKNKKGTCKNIFLCLDWALPSPQSSTTIAKPHQFCIFLCLPTYLHKNQKRFFLDQSIVSKNRKNNGPSCNTRVPQLPLQLLQWQRQLRALMLQLGHWSSETLMSFACTQCV